MTFGQTLKQLLLVSGIKSTFLAESLGYDTSYVSRWVNDIKMPSLKNNEDLFEKISDIIVSNCNAAARETLREIYISDGQAQNLETAVSSVLRETFNGDKSASLYKAVAPNAAYYIEGAVPNGNDMFADAIIRSVAEGQSSEINCITTAPLSIASNEDTLFWQTVQNALLPRGDVHIIMNQIVNMKDFASNIDRYCAAICTFSDFSDLVHYKFYKDESDADLYSVQYTFIEDSLLVTRMITPVSGAVNSLSCTDKAVLAPNYHLFVSKLQMQKRLLRHCRCCELSDGQFLYNFVMGGDIKYLLNVMHPIYMTRELYTDLMGKYMPENSNDDFMIYFNSLCANAKKKVIVYRSALLEYIYNGVIYFSGSTVTLSKKDREIHLEQLLENIKNGNCELSILDDINPILNREKINLALYLSKSAGFAVSMTSSDTALKLCSARAVEYFNQFFNHLLELPKKYILIGNDAEAFIRRGMQLLAMP